MRRKKFAAVVLSIAILFGLIPATSVSASQADDLINVAMGELHNTDGTKYGVSGAWCDAFIRWCADQANIPTSVLPRLYGTESYRSQSNYHARGTYSPKRGDIVLLDWDFDNISDHVEIVTGVHSDGVYTIGGNTSLSSNSSVYGVETKTRYNYKSWGQILGYLEVNYGSDPTPPTITSLIVTNKSTSSFTINCTANETLSKAYIIIYNSTYPNGIGLNVNNINSASFSKTINTSEYGGGDTFAAHIYVYDTVGNAAIGKTGEFSLTNIAVNSLTVSNITDSGFTLNCTANQKISRAYVIIYNSTYPNGRGFNIDNINNKSFSKTITASDYGGGNTFAAHIYIYDTLGNAAIGKTGEFSLTNIAVANFTVSNITDNSFTLNCTASQKISRAYLIIYNSTYPNGAGLNVNNINSNSFSKQINISDYGGTGEYSVHVYVYDSSDNSASGKTGKFYVPQSLANTSTATTATRSIGRIEVQTKIYNLSQNASCIAAVYSVDGALLGQTANNVNSSTNSVSAYFPNYSNASYVKVFLWDSLEGMKPLTNGEKVTL